MSGAKGPKHIYFLRATGIGLVKIGCSREPEKRLMQLHQVSPVALDLVLRVPGNHNDEWHIHRTFREERMHSEWFRDSPLINDLIDRLRSGQRLSDVIGASPTYKERGRILRPPKSRRPPRPKINQAKIRSLIKAGLPMAEIGRRMNCSRQFVFSVKNRARA